MLRLEWDQVNCKYTVDCDVCSPIDDERMVIGEWTYKSPDGIHRPPYQRGEARTKAGAAFRRHVDKHLGRSDEREYIARAVARQPKPLSGASKRALERFGIGASVKVPIDPNDPPPF